MLTYVLDKDDKDAALLGEGAFGKTYKMRNKIDDQIYAVKMIKVTS
jgi:serine/threonine protein kinase